MVLKTGKVSIYVDADNCNILQMGNNRDKYKILYFHPADNLLTLINFIKIKI